MKLDPATPKGAKQAQKASGSSGKRMKQTTLLSFFSKQKTPTVVKKEDTGSSDKGGRLLFVGQHAAAPPSSAGDESSVMDATNTSTTSPNTSTTVTTTSIKSEYSKGLSQKEEEEDDDDQPLARRHKRTVNYTEGSESEDDDEALTSNKRRRKLFHRDPDDSEDDAYVPDVKQEVEEEEEDVDDDDDDLLALEKRPSQSKAKSITASKYLQKQKGKPATPPRREQSPKHSKFNKQNEERYQWLVNIRDAQGKEPQDPDYDPRTLYIPSTAWNKFTPFEKQYWEIKSKMWDCVVFFKKGKFFELYEKDAILGNTLFDLKLAGGGRANMQLAGIPEMSFDHWATQFIQHGYKVAKVDQKESMLAKEMREGSKGIVKRELQYVLTSGTLTDGNMLHSDLSTYCLAIKEDSQEDGKKIFGVAFVDTSTGQIRLLEFEDDNECTKLDTVMSQVKPKELIMAKNNLSNLATKIIKFSAAPQAIFNYVKAGEEFYDFDKTYDELCINESTYFPMNGTWPTVLKSYYENNKRTGLSAFGGLLYYLKWLKLDKSLISLGNIEEYNMIDSQSSMVLDGISLQNLEIFANSFDGSDKGTLFKLLNKAITPMGKRMMKYWTMHPLLYKEDIEKRLRSVDLLLSDLRLRELLESYFSKLPDLERLLARIHSQNLKMKDFDKTIQGFETISELLSRLSDFNLEGAIKVFASQIPESLFKDVEKWTHAFDRKKAINEDILEPERGVEPEFDESLDRIANLENELNTLLSQYKKRFKCSSIQYKDSGKEIYTIEVPVSISKMIPANWVQMGANKSTKRYYSDEVSSLARSMAEAREMHKVIEQDLKNRLCKKFDTHYSTTWMPTIHAISNMDCILSLVRASESLGFPSCRPTFVDDICEESGARSNGFINFKSLRHPCFNVGSSAAKDFIPNDIELGKDVPQLGLLTGANAAGKSTVLRMTCIAVIMAQIGCYVPCDAATLTPIDRIMTRLGANDNIMQGKSTFFVELSETKKIMDLATNRSLLVIDELGRGGSSSDGFAIAESVLYHVATHIQSLGFFATHYGSLGLSFKGHPQVRPLKMSILVDEKTRNITFLYKLLDGQSEGSFGMHVASMCGIPEDVVSGAQNAADTLEHTSQLIRERKLALENAGITNTDSVGVPLGLQADFVRLVYGDGLTKSKHGTGEGVRIYDQHIKRNALQNILRFIENI